MFLRRMYIFLPLGEKFCIHLLRPFFSYSIVQFLCFFIDFLTVLSIIESRVLKSPTIIVLLSISPFRSVNIIFIYLGALMLCVYIYNCYMFLLNWPFYHYIMTFFVSRDRFWLKVYFVWFKYHHLCFLLVTICVKYLFLSLHFQLICVLELKVSFL